MPLFGTNYEVEIDRDKMAWEAILDSGDRVMVSPHLCKGHEHSQDHRGWIDISFLEMSPIGFYLPPKHLVLDLEQASVFVEGLTEVAQWARLNQELGEEQG